MLWESGLKYHSGDITFSEQSVTCAIDWLVLNLCKKGGGEEIKYLIAAWRKGHLLSQTAEQ